MCLYVQKVDRTRINNIFYIIIELWYNVNKIKIA